jgi:thiol:disulfide interchange protein DsbC
MKKTILAAACTCLTLTAGLAGADEAEISKSLAAVFGPRVHIDEVRKTGILGLYEIRSGTNIMYADEKGSYFIQGDIIEAKSKKSLTEERRNKLMQISFSDLPLDLAVKTVRGNGRRVFATFEDPNCGYCKKLAKDMATMTDITIYTFLMPILSPDSTTKSKAVWCASDRSKSWNDWMISGADPARAKTAKANCDTPIDKILDLGHKLGVNATPTIFLSNGERIPGAVPAVQLSQELDRVAAAK